MATPDVSSVQGILDSELGSLALGGLGGFGLQQLGVFEGEGPLGILGEGGLLGAPSKAGSRAAGEMVAGKEQAIETLMRELSPFREAGIGALPALQQGATAGGFGQNIAALLAGGAIQPLIDERFRTVQNQSAAGGLTRSGAGLQAAAAAPTDLLLQIEQMLNQRQSGLVQGGQQAATTLGTGVGNFQAGIGQDIGQGILADQQAKAGQQEQLFNIATTAASFFSDPALKTNVKKIGESKGLGIYTWEWIKETAGTIIAKYPTIGFMADQVKDKYPQFIQEFGGYMVVDYDGLLNEMEAA
jgi:hypothetical protein